jgi:hypothetical protein
MSRKTSKEKAMEAMSARPATSDVYKPPKTAKEAAKRVNRLSLHIGFERKKVDGKHVVHGTIHEHDIGGLDNSVPQEYTDMAKMKEDANKKIDEYASAFGESTGE